MIEVLNDFVAIVADKDNNEDVSRGGIVIPATAKTGAGTLISVRKGTLVSVGPDCKDKRLARGAQVLFPNGLYREWDGCVFLKQADLFGIYEKRAEDPPAPPLPVPEAAPSPLVLVNAMGEVKQ